MPKKRAKTPPAPRAKVWHGPNGETWQEPPLNSPVQAKPGWLTKQLQDAANAKPIPPALFRDDGRGGYLGLGGGGGFSLNNNLLTGRKPMPGIPDGVPGRTVGLIRPK
jgi:hypothetical protein